MRRHPKGDRPKSEILTLVMCFSNSRELWTGHSCAVSLLIAALITLCVLILAVAGKEGSWLAPRRRPAHNLREGLRVLSWYVIG